ncbi:MAG: hypothetical protein ABI615_03670 [Chthoniobacterales bacterium]
MSPGFRISPLGVLLAVGVLMSILFSPALKAQEQQGGAVIKPPFGVYWGLSADRLQKTIEETKAKVVETREINGRKALIVEGLVYPGLQRAIFYFVDDGLNEVELQYGQANLDSTGYSTYFDSMRRSLERKYGTGRLVTRSKKRDGETLMTIIGYQWTQAGCGLQVFYFSAERGADGYHLVSLHYRGA